MSNPCKILYGKSSTGKIKQWSCDINPQLNSDGYVELYLDYGYVDGKKQRKVRIIKSGKNIGKSNETTIFEQAQLECDRLYQDQIDDGYVYDTAELSDELSHKQVKGKPNKPRLASKYYERKHKLVAGKKYGFMMKMNGIRGFITKISEDEVVFSSRSGKLFAPFNNLSKEALSLMDIGDELDGEFYIHGMIFEDIDSIVTTTKNHKPEREQMEFHCFDYIQYNTSQKYINRYDAINDKITVKGKSLSLIKITELDIFEYNEEYIEERLYEAASLKYEGGMIIDLDAPYEYGKRNDYLMKAKKMKDDEFKVIDIIPNDQDPRPKFIIDLRSGNTCEVIMKGDKDNQGDYLANKHLYIGKYLKVQYQEYTSKGSLSFPVALCFRSGNEINGDFFPDF